MMTGSLSSVDKAKLTAAMRSVEYIEDGMCVGLGTGSTSSWMIRCLGLKARRENLNLTCVPTSNSTEKLARQVGLKTIDVDKVKEMDVTIDGADQVDGEFTLVKGGGGALLREKIIASSSSLMIVIADSGKRVETLGAYPLPVEVAPFGLPITKSQIDDVLGSLNYISRNIGLRMNGSKPFATDGGNHILDLNLARIGNAGVLSSHLNMVPGVVENGLFVNMCDIGIFADDKGTVETRNVKEGDTRTDDADMHAFDALVAELGI
ncbi:MAG: ribose-5-phosphate isomerase RpiA [Roseovarius sp.]|nr:ribose-5-phosphate isomerase RpiA [Roseovarius sp.]MCY4292048.1 ribose-5-phosphate isomerase RpiA [Roseovarius sp.]